MKSPEIIFLLIAHGSRLPEANREIEALARGLSRSLSIEVIPCFLELCEPSTPAAIDLAVSKGAKIVKILPYFLSEGRHVRRDIPGILQGKTAQYPQVRLELLDYFGKDPLLLEALTKAFKAQLS